MSKYQQFSNSVVKGSRVLSNNSALILKSVFNGFLIAIALGLLGCFNFINMSVDFSTITKSAFWIHTGIRTISFTILFICGTNLTIEKEKATNELLLKYEKDYNEKIKLKDRNFEEFVVKVLNKRIKKETYIKNMQKKLYRLEKRASNEDKLLFNSILPENQEKKLHNKFCIKKQRLLDLMSDTYLDKELENLTVNYQYVDPSVFNLNIECQAEIDDYKVKSEIGKNRVMKTSSIITSMVLVSMITSTFFINPDMQEFKEGVAYVMNAIISMTIDIGVGIFNLFKGIVYTPKLVNEEYVLPYANRIKVLDEYIEWSSTQEKSKSFKVSEYINQTKGEEPNVE